MKKQPWLILCVLALSMLACSVFSGGVQQQSEDSIASSPEATQDLRREHKQTTATTAATVERSPTEEEPQQAPASPPARTETPAAEEETGPTILALEAYQVEEEFALNVVGVNIEFWEYGYMYCPNLAKSHINKIPFRDIVPNDGPDLITYFNIQSK